MGKICPSFLICIRVHVILQCEIFQCKFAVKYTQTIYLVQYSSNKNNGFTEIRRFIAFYLFTRQDATDGHFHSVVKRVETPFEYREKRGWGVITLFFSTYSPNPFPLL